MIFLDDNRVPYDVFRTTIHPIYENNRDWVIVRSYNEFEEVIKEMGLPTHVSFDHDLSYDAYLPENQEGVIDYDNLEEKTGYHAAKLLIEICEKQGKELPKHFVHSANPIGSKNILNLLDNVKPL